jgi:hypothetical protein
LLWLYRFFRLTARRGRFGFLYSRLVATFAAATAFCGRFHFGLTDLGQYIVRRLNVVLFRPSQLFGRRHAAAIAPALLGRMAAAAMVHTGINLARFRKGI